MSYAIFIVEDKGPGSVDLSDAPGAVSLSTEATSWLLDFAEKRGVSVAWAIEILIERASGSACRQCGHAPCEC